ncbi:GNAT family N-acetyltransferase [Paenibacillus filicis]|uniref:GNAT family N-acetyltransferase n=1 Tax=Paenibacillus filicis TaxID=669464 RepID=A0ABU9DIP2_9BACL
MIEIIPLTPETAAPYRAFTYRTYQAGLGGPEGEAGTLRIALGVSFMGEPAGLLLAHPPEQDEPARVLSVFVEKRFRKLGIAGALMSELKACLTRIGLKQACVEYYALHSYQALERVLLRSGWQSPEVYSRYYRCDIVPNRETRWIHRFKLPDRYTVMPWGEVRRDELTLMNQLQEQDFNTYFRPLFQEEHIEPNCSLVLKLGAEIVGWSIVDRQLADTLLYRTLYIREAYRDLGLGILLAAQSAQRIARTDAAHLVIQILTGNERMQKVAERMLVPMNPIVTEYKRAVWNF